MFSSLRHRNFRLFWSGNLISLIGSWMQTVALSWLIYRITSSPFLLGFIGFANAIPILFVTPFGGVITDRMNKRILVIITQTSAMVLAFALVALNYFWNITVTQIFIITVLSGIVAAVDMPARQSFVVEMVGKEDLMNAIALNSMGFNAARIIGPAIAGYLVIKFGETGCFFINGLSFLAVLLSLFMMEFPPQKEKPQQTESLVENMMVGFRYVREHTIISGLLLLVAVPSVLTLSYTTLMPIFAKEIFHRDADSMGVFFSCIGIGAVIGALTVAKFSKLKIKGKMLIWGAVSSSLMILFFALSRNFYLSCFILAIVGFSNVTYLATNNTLIQSNVSDELRGRVVSFYGVIFLGLLPIGSLLLGSIANYIHAPYTISLCAGICLLYTLYMNWKMPQLRQLV